MPAVQVAALHTFQSYQQLRDEEFKWVRLPYYQAYKGMNKASQPRNIRAQNQSAPEAVHA